MDCDGGVGPEKNGLAGGEFVTKTPEEAYGMFQEVIPNDPNNPPRVLINEYTYGEDGSPKKSVTLPVEDFSTSLNEGALFIGWQVRKHVSDGVIERVPDQVCVVQPVAILVVEEDGRKIILTKKKLKNGDIFVRRFYPMPNYS